MWTSLCNQITTWKVCLLPARQTVIFLCSLSVSATYYLSHLFRWHEGKTERRTICFGTRLLCGAVKPAIGLTNLLNLIESHNATKHSCEAIGICWCVVNTIKRDRIIVIVTCFLSLEIVCWRDRAMSWKIIWSWANARLEPSAGLWERILFAFVPQPSQRDFRSSAEMLDFYRANSARHKITYETLCASFWKNGNKTVFFVCSQNVEKNTIIFF